MKRQFRRSFEVISVLGFPHFSPLALQSQSLYLAISFILWCVSMQIVRWFDADCSDFQHDFMLCFLWSFVTFWQSALCNSLKIGDGLAWGYLAFQIFKAYNWICKQLWEFVIYTFIYVFMQNRCMCIVSVSIRKQGGAFMVLFALSTRKSAASMRDAALHLFILVAYFAVV